jgi:ribosomal protein L16 Arg81 hydroxylase
MLSRCVSTDTGAFATDYWGRKPLLSRHTALPRDFSDLLSPAAVDELIAERGVRAPFIRMAKTGDVLARSCYTGPAGFGAEMPDQVDSAKVLAEFATGATIVLQGLHRLWPPLIDFVRALTDDLGHPVQANAYITPPAAQGFEPHYDVHDVFVLQVAGEKRWTVHEPVHPHPLDSQPWTDHRDAVTARSRDNAAIDTVLNAGDALYLPRGWVHSARSEDTTSIHLTIGVSALTYLDVVRAVVDTLATDDEFRKSLPMGIDATDRSEMASTTSKVMAQLADALRERTSDLSDSAAAKLSDRHAHKTRPVAVRPLATLDAMNTAGTLKVRWRHGLIGTLHPLGAKIKLRLPDKTITFPESCATALEALQHGLVADAETLPGLDHADAQVLIRRLLREAVVVAAQE